MSVHRSLLFALLVCWASVVNAQSTSLFIPLDPRATFLPIRSDDPDARVAEPVSLVGLGIKPGDTISLQVRGDYVVCVYPCSGSTMRTAGLFSSSTSARDSIPCNLPPLTITNIPNDFQVGGDTGGSVTVQVPANATFLFLAALDYLYGDSSDPDDDYGVILTSSRTIPPRISFQDVSQTSGIADQSIQTRGVQWIDFNKDRRLDLFLVGTNGVALFENLGGGQFVDVTAKSRLDKVGANAIGASWADIDNDGDPDLFLAISNGDSLILRNDKGVFVKIAAVSAKLSKLSSAGGVQGGIWLDFNNDKEVDLFVVNDRRPNQLLKHSGFAGYEDIAPAAGLAVASSGRSAIAADFNNDGYDDLFVVNFKKKSRLYLNNKNETFTDITSSAKVGFSCACKQVTAADYDNDGFLDLFLVNSQGQSRLYRNDGNLKFEDKTKLAGLSKPKKAVAAAFADFDIDGNEDLVIVQSSGGNFVYKNDGKGRFHVATEIDLSNPDNPTGIAIGDFNNDGTPDIAIGDGDTSQQHGDSLYENTGGPGNNFLTVVLSGKSSNKSAIGARVVLQTAFTFQVKAVGSGNGHNQESLPLDFGLGVAPIVDLMHITWPSGKTQDLKNIPANKVIKVKEN